MQLNKLFENFLENRTLENQDAISKFYIYHSDNRKEIEQEIKNFIRKDSKTPPIEWHFFFENNMNFWKEVFLVEEEKKAIQNLERYKKSQQHEYILKASSRISKFHER